MASTTTTSTSQNETASLQSTQCHLLKLPAELRLEIYELVLANLDIGYSLQREYPSILQVCKLLRHEAVAIFNKRLSAALARYKAQVEIARAERHRSEKKYNEQRERLMGVPSLETLLDAINACDVFSAILDDYTGVRRVVQRERTKLRLEGFRV
ncbi:hypothetical protein DOTSEDRAFT_18941 [Dothistroma septosporum NZE10]|uniref:F-box domain-containing protein n=1 Tax=Dothistroma septosporum (strain NZE10 / CBS 128990) TaxID=675120 RepID=N1Q188_DOTSN|nr:hypothetical protein DOTSEDRAFT_18941 [Dothistroma septosporum NZE10]